jgi:hypothetical protein
MNSALVKIVCIAVWVFAALTTSATPLKTPRRMVQGRTVDLKPLFTWWASHAGDRPLASWVHINGKVIGTNGFGWIVEGQVEGSAKGSDESEKTKSSADGKLVLKNPPITEMAEFAQSHAQLRSLTDKVKQLSKQVETASEKVKQLNALDQTARKRRARSRAVEQDLRNWRATEKNDREQLQSENKQLDELKKKFPGPVDATYQLDCFALETGEKNGAMAVYDHGAPAY